MISEPDYGKATNAAYEILKKYKGGYPHIDIFRIVCMYPQVKVHTYSEIASRLGISVEKFISEYAESDMGYTVFDPQNKRWLIFFNDKKSESTIRFTIAHELGHIVLCHYDDNPTTNKEANCFARNILCPVPIRDELGLVTLDDYCSAFDISDKMAQVVIDRNPSDAYYISKSNYEAINDNVYFYFTGNTLSEIYGFY